MPGYNFGGGNPWDRLFPNYSRPNPNAYPRFRADSDDSRFRGYYYGAAKEDDSDKIIDVFEPAEGSLLILNKQLDSLNLEQLRDKMRKKQGYLFNTVAVEQGVLISWAPKYSRTA